MRCDLAVVLARRGELEEAQRQAERTDDQHDRDSPGAGPVRFDRAFRVGLTTRSCIKLDRMA
ncbi:hypothetical protein ACFV4E_15140 [Streptomyces hygroscopicus]|uniref:hypothetical protein n=1 Tax=Streptomyces TaxID=1883 RepID=UPI003679EEE9